MDAGSLKSFSGAYSTGGNGSGEIIEPAEHVVASGSERDLEDAVRRPRVLQRATGGLRA